MKIGKVPNDLLAELLREYRSGRPEVVVGPGIGNDIAAVDTAPDLCVLSSDPITAAGKNSGRLAVHIACNDIASSGAEPFALLTTVLLPPGYSEKKLIALVREVSETCETAGIAVIGGHTEITNSVRKPVIVTTAVGKCARDKLITAGGAREGDAVIMTKTAGLEGSAILAFDHTRKLGGAVSAAMLKEARGYMEKISVIKDCAVAAAFGATSMHDITEGGVLGAVWEVCAASGKGALIDEEAIPVTEATHAICAVFGIDPAKLISSGSLLLTTSQPDRMMREFDNAGINAAIIGHISASGDGLRLRRHDGNVCVIPQPDSDEIYKISKH